MNTLINPAQLTIPQAKIVGTPRLVTYGRNDDSVFQSRLMVPGIGRGGGVGFIDVAVFDGAEQAAEQLGSGALVTFVGQLRFREWEDRTTGAKRSALSASGTLYPYDDEQPDTTDRGAE